MENEMTKEQMEEIKKKIIAMMDEAEEVDTLMADADSLSSGELAKKALDFISNIDDKELEDCWELDWKLYLREEGEDPLHFLLQKREEIIAVFTDWAKNLFPDIDLDALLIDEEMKDEWEDGFEMKVDENIIMHKTGVKALYDLTDGYTGMVQVSFFPDFSAICKIGKAPFNGTLEISYVPDEWFLEFESFEAHLKEISMKDFTIESFCAYIYQLLHELLSPEKLLVTVRAETIKHSPVYCSLNSEGYIEP